MVDTSAITTALEAKINRNYNNASYQPIMQDDLLSSYPYIYVKESYTNGVSGYRVYSDGYCIQWGRSNDLDYGKSEIITLSKTYADMNYTIAGASPYRQTGGGVGSSWALQCYANNQIRYRSGFEQKGTGDTKQVEYRWAYWRTEGYLAAGQY